MWTKSKFLLFSICLQLMCLSIFSSGGSVKAETNTPDGFVIKAEKVDGTGMLATIVRQETSTNDSRLMLRIHYQTATIYGMNLTKEVDSPSGPVSITLKAKGPVVVKGMTVDTTAISFQGACIKAAELVPEIEMEHVVMVAHYMDSKESNLQQLLQNIISGKAEPTQPSTMSLLQDLGKLSGKELEEEITKITSGHLPLMCVNGSVDSGASTNPIHKVIDVVKDPLYPITKPLGPVTKGIDPVLKPITKPLDPILKPVKKPLKPVLKPFEPVTKRLDGILKPLKPVTNQLDSVLKTVNPKETVDQTIQSVCVNLQEAKGIINKELALNLIDEAIKQKQDLTSICQDDETDTKWIKKWNDSLLYSLGLLDVLEVLKPEDPLEQLQMMRDKVKKAKDGSIIFSP